MSERERTQSGQKSLVFSLPTSQTPCNAARSIPVGLNKLFCLIGRQNSWYWPKVNARTIKIGFSLARRRSVNFSYFPYLAGYVDAVRGKKIHTNVWKVRKIALCYILQTWWIQSSTQYCKVVIHKLCKIQVWKKIFDIKHWHFWTLCLLVQSLNSPFFPHASYPGLSFRAPGFSPYMGREERRGTGLFVYPSRWRRRRPIARWQGQVKRYPFCWGKREQTVERLQIRASWFSGKGGDWELQLQLISQCVIRSYNWSRNPRNLR